MADLRRALAAEVVGTAFLTTAVIGSGIMAERLADDPAIALLANTLATAAALAVLIATLGPISGAHLNPAVTLALALRRETPARTAGVYITAQLAGAMGGLGVALAMFEMPLAAGDIERAGGGQVFAESVATFGLVGLILLARASRPRDVPWLVAAWIAAAYWFTSSTSFANPSVTIARAFTDSMTGIRPIDVPPFVVAQLAGGLAAVAATKWLAPSRQRG